MKNLKKLNLTNFIIFFLLISCQKEELIPEFSHPYSPKIKPLDSHIKRVVIAATNNFNGEIRGSIEESLPNVKISVGGDNLVYNYVKALRKVYNNELLLVDGGYIINKHSTDLEEEKTLNLYSRLNYDAVLLTENEISHLNNNEVRLPYINANIYDIKKDKLHDEFSSKPYIIKKINDVRVALVGITTYKKDLKHEGKLLGLLFNDPIASLLTLKKDLQKKADVVVLVLHSKTKCSTENEKTSLCPQNIETFSKFIKRLPPNLVDIIIGGDSNYASGIIEGLPVIQNFGHGQYMGRLEFFYDQKLKKVIKNKTIVYKPTKMCSHFYEATKDCHLEVDKRKKIELIRKAQFKLIEASFLGKPVLLNTY